VTRDAIYLPKWLEALMLRTFVPCACLSVTCAVVVVDSASPRLNFSGIDALSVIECGITQHSPH
jgi:hypothetical protein